MLYNVMLSFVGKFRREKTWRYTQILYFFCETLKFQMNTIPSIPISEMFTKIDALKPCQTPLPETPSSQTPVEFLNFLVPFVDIAAAATEALARRIFRVKGGGLVKEISSTGIIL